MLTFLQFSEGDHKNRPFTKTHRQHANEPSLPGSLSKALRPLPKVHTVTRSLSPSLLKTPERLQPLRHPLLH